MKSYREIGMYKSALGIMSKITKIFINMGKQQ